MKQLSIITSNLNKLNEIRTILGPDIPFEIVHKNIDLAEYQGDIEFIITEKCKLAAELVNGPVLVEDTSLRIDALNGLPGPYIKWFFDTIGPDGIYRMVKDWSDKSATAICMAGYSKGPNWSVHTFKGTIRGQIVEPKVHGFGFPFFRPHGYAQTFDEMEDSLKHTISHTFHAFTAVRHFLITTSH